MGQKCISTQKADASTEPRIKLKFMFEPAHFSVVGYFKLTGGFKVAHHPFFLMVSLQFAVNPLPLSRAVVDDDSACASRSPGCAAWEIGDSSFLLFSVLNLSTADPHSFG